MRQAHSEYLVRAHRRVAALTIDHIVEAASVIVPELPIEGFGGSLRQLRAALRGRGVLEPIRELSHHAQSIKPERLNFDCLAAPRSHDVVSYFRIHPGKLDAIGA